ncbi:MAG: 50S ribosomal protein L18, partial [bacterium]|nr:50S ribosomal protein L18 [bacterium]
LKVSRDKHRRRIHRRIRRRLQGTAERPRLSVFRSLHHIYAQVVDDRKGRTVAAASSAEKGAGISNGANVSAATQVGKTLAERAKEHGITKVVFDRGGYKYHGRVKALAEAAREAGLEF